MGGGGVKWWDKLKEGGNIANYLVIVNDYEEVIKFEIGKMVPVERHYEEIKIYMAKNYPDVDYIITFFTKNIRIN